MFYVSPICGLNRFLFFRKTVQRYLNKYRLSEMRENGTKLSAASFPNASKCMDTRLSTATEAVRLRSHATNGAPVGWLPWIREELCVSCRLAATLRLEPGGGEASASPTPGDTRLIQLRLANILACYTAAN